MSHDIIADVLNEIMNAKRARKSSIITKKHSKLLISVLEVAKKQGYILDFKIKERELEINFNLNECKAVKPRFDVQIKDFEKYIRRYLPSRDFGIIIVSTSKGLMTLQEAEEKNLGGCLIAYFY
jgi:small subunit ribosomal protein S8